jgi:hypothetical protein
MNCTICKKPIVLEPSASERAKRDVTGRPASFYQRLFTAHAQCQLKQREDAARALLRRGAQ